MSTKKDGKKQAFLSNRVRRRRVLLLLECSTICLFKHKGYLFMCVYCNKGYADPSKLRAHYNRQKCVKPEVLGRTITNMGLLKADITNISCKLCNTPINRLDDLISHLTQNHNKKINRKPELEIIPYKLNIGNYQCAICDKKYTEYKPLARHTNKHFPKFVCDICGANFITGLRLKVHAVTHTTGSFKCSSCDKVFGTKDAMKGHYQYAHMKLKKHNCPQCPEKFLNNYQRLKHLASTHGVKLKEYKCAFCPSVFKVVGALHNHERGTHLKERKFGCNECGAQFYAKSGLTRHMLAHTGEKKYQCDICHKAFARKYRLVLHMKTHDF